MHKYNKYHVSPKNERTADGITFASKAEMLRYLELKQLQKLRKITALILQPRFLLVPKTKNKRAVYYVADFQYIQDGKTIVEDVKGVKTEVYKIKIKMFLWKYPDLIFFENKT
jgi:gp72 family protein|nr:MAG TPA: Endonuclease [Caudoviricetes sp.]